MPKPNREPTPDAVMGGAIVYNEGKAIDLMRKLYGKENVNLNRCDFWAVHVSIAHLEKKVNNLIDVQYKLLLALQELSKQLKG
jgi:hypothetical protein